MLKTSKITVSCDGAKLTISPKGDIDHHSARTLRERIENEMYINRPEILFLDLSGIDLWTRRDWGFCSADTKEQRI